ncbi:uncharacterized protein ATC70_009903 [Mucor velutinosus]|uniref:GDP/GTP exchange factor Sec2 N-terminal domain-containing protein n=1 Tax=Mucor velutinosus TaxID=708070 RepID=A0AAN7I3D4_9FUNG|nr:hypothetical protein ATC70_009903 [Mucor velutinosus]
MMYTEHHQQDPLILLNSHHMDDMLVPITIKPLPALLAPPANLSLSATSLQTPNATNSSYYHHTSDSHQTESMSVSEPSPLPHATLPDLPSQLPAVSSPNYYSVIQKQSQEIQELRQDLVRLNQKYVDQIERMQTAEHAKHQVESELEDLSLRLFEQANQMVSDEKKARFHAERKAALLERELIAVYEELGNERAQLNELRVKLYEPFVHPLDQQPSAQHISPLQEPQLHSIQHGISTAAYLDHNWLNLFKGFLTLAPKTPLEHIHKLQFMKQCLELDIEPCLRFGNNAKGGHLSWKRALDAILHQSCFIESETSFMKRLSHDTAASSASTAVTAPLIVARRSSFAQLASRFRPSSASAVVKQLCYGCGTELQAPLFRFRLKEQDTDSYTIDRSCRDRLVAVCDFYVFIRHVRLGLQSQKTIQCLFRECVWLRLCMFWARSGIHHDDSVLSVNEE